MYWWCCNDTILTHLCYAGNDKDAYERHGHLKDPIKKQKQNKTKPENEIEILWAASSPEWFRKIVKDLSKNLLNYLNMVEYMRCYVTLCDI